MSIDLQILEDRRLIVGRLYGRLQTQHVTDAFVRLRQQPGFEAGMNRLLLAHRSLTTDHIDVDQLERLQASIRNSENAAKIQTPDPDDILSLKSAFVCADSRLEIYAKFYRALWQADPLMDVDFRYFRELEDALHWLDCPDLQIPPEFLA